MVPNVWHVKSRHRIHAVVLGLIVSMGAGCTTFGQSTGSGGVEPMSFRSQSPEAIAPGRLVNPGPALGPANDLQWPAVLAEEGLPDPELGADVEPQGPVLSVKVVGNESVTESEIRRHIKTRQDRAYDAHLIQEDLRRLFGTRKFQNVRVQKKLENGGVHVTFEVVERPLLNQILFVGNRNFSDKKLLKEAGLAKGDALNIYLVQEARRKIEEFYHSKGFVKAQVTIVEGEEASDRRIVLQVDEGRVERIWDVEFIGNDPKLATDARLKTIIKSKPGFLKYLFRGKVDFSLIEEDRQRLVSYYRALGYFQARISRELDYDDSNQWLRLIFVIDEGPRYKIRNVSVVGNNKYTSEALVNYLELREGEFFNLEAMETDERKLRDLYGGKGHIFANIKASPRFLEQPGELDLVYQIEEGELFRVGKINIHVAGSSPHTRRDVILNRLSLQPGDIVDIREVRASERRLKASQLFIANPAEGTPPQIVIRPPDLSEAASMAEKQGRYRGQSPDGEGEDSARLMVLDVFVPQISVDQR